MNVPCIPDTWHVIPDTLDHRRFFVNPEHFLHYLNDLAQCGIRMDGFHKIWHGVLRAFQGDAESIECLPDASVIARLTEFTQAPHLPVVALRIHFKDGNGQWFLLGVGVHTHDLADALVDLALITVGGIRDLALEESLFDRRDDP